jgi:hypothetical protein
MKKLDDEISEVEEIVGEIVRKSKNHLVVALEDALADGLKIHLVVFKKGPEFQIVIMPYVKRILLKKKRYEQVIDKLKQIVEKNKNEFGTLISVYEGDYEKDLKLVASKKII